MQIKVEKMKSLKTKPRKTKRDDWKRERQAKRKAKMQTREMAYAS